MTDLTRSYEIVIDAPVHVVFEYCRDPRHLFQGWPVSESVSAVFMARTMNGMLAAIKAGVESPSSSSV